MIGAHNQPRGDTSRVSLGMAGVPLPRWPIEPVQHSGTETVEAAQPAVATKQDEQAALRQYAATLLTEASTETKPEAAAPVSRKEQAEGVSPFSIAAMLLLAGCIFLVVIPPVGVTFLLCAVLPLIWGAGTTALGSS